jgi:hypothetical protein
MRRCFLLLAILLVLGATGTGAQIADDSSPVSFRISSVKSPFALAGTFEGEYLVKENSIEVTISSASVSLRNYGTYEGRRQLSFINIGLASVSETGKWKVIAHGFAIPVGETMKPGDKYRADERMRFTLPRDGSVDLTKCWLVVEMGELTLDPSDEDKVGYAFAHSDRSIFSPLVVKAAKK